MIARVFLIIILSFSFIRSQTTFTGCALGGAMSNGKATGCGNSPNPCNMAASYSLNGSFCGNTVIGGTAGTQTVTSNLVLPAACNATLSIEIKKRPNIHPTGCNNSGMDGSDGVFIGNTGGIITSQGATICCSSSSCTAYPGLPTATVLASSYIPTGCSNADGIARMTVTGGTITLKGFSDRLDEAATYSIDLDPTTCGASCNSVLPIQLNKFWGQAFENEIKLFWKVSSETDLSHYEIFKSTDAINYNRVGSVPSLKPDNIYNFVYQFTDDNPSYGLSYYKLRSIDIDQTFDDHPIIALNFNRKNNNFWYHNTKSGIIIGVNSYNRESQFELIDLNGKIIQLLDFSTGQHIIEQGAINQGIYLIVDKKGAYPPYKVVVLN